MAFGMAEELSREDQRFLKERAPQLLQVIEEAKQRSFDEVLEEAMERVGELQDEWSEAREDGADVTLVSGDGLLWVDSIVYVFHASRKNDAK